MRNLSRPRSFRLAVVSPAVGLALVSALPLGAGGFLETADITDPQPTPVSAFKLVDVVPVRWDARCIPVPFRVNDTLDPIPNPLPGPPLRVTETLPALEAAQATWNRVPTSFLEHRLEGTTDDNPGTARFDFVNEWTFRPNAFVVDENLVAATSVTALMKDMFLEDGVDIDEDGDPDVARGLARCRDVDGDGDFELPEGDYPAGTLLDADVTFNTDRQRGFRFTVGDQQVDANPRSADLQGVATHEAGHTQGLAHSLTNQISATDGTGAVLFPTFDLGDPVSELALRVLHVEDVAASSALYPEGTAVTGPAALEPGDVAFDDVFAVIRGDTRHGEKDLPLAGASVFAVDLWTGEVLGSAVTGTVRQLLNINTGDIGRLFRTLPELHLLDGRYTLVVPAGRAYRIGIEAVDNAPVGGSQVNETVNVGVSFFLADFPEELYNGPGESAVEVRPGQSVPVLVVKPGSERTGIDLVTNRVQRLGNTGTRQGLLFHRPGSLFAVQIPAAELTATVGTGELLPVTALFHTGIGDQSDVPRFRRAALTRGKIRPDGTAKLDLDRPLAEIRPFVGQDDDRAPFHLPLPRILAAKIRRLLDLGELENLFLVLAGPAPGAPGRPAVGIREVGPFSGRSFRSKGGPVFTPVTDADFLFQLVLSPVR